MKKLKTAFIILLMPLLYYLLVTGYTETGLTKGNKLPVPVSGKNFENVIFNLDSSTISNASFDRSQWIPGQIPYYKGALNFTGIQSYEFGSDNFGFFNEYLTGQQPQNIEGLNSIVASNDLDFYFHRPNISNLCYGQRVVFLVTQPPGNNTVNDGFCFGSTGGEYTTDQGRNVLHASDIEENPNGYWLAKNIYENKSFAAFDDFGHGATGKWYIKPMMRIPVNTPDNAQVVRIDVVNYSNQVIKQILLKARNFKVGGNYNGEYIEKFIFDQNIDSLTVIGGRGEPHDPATELNEGVPQWIKIPNCGYYHQWHTNCHVDFKIYWLGEVECWLEKMTVDEEMANGLFEGLYDDLIDDELSNTAHNGFTYYVDEITTSDVPCIQYVQGKIDVYNLTHEPDAKILCATNFTWDVRSRVQETAFSKSFLQTMQPPTVELNMVDVFEIFPGTLPEGVFQNYDSRIPNSWFGSRENYTRIVQYSIFGDRDSRTPQEEQSDGCNHNDIQVYWYGNCDAWFDYVRVDNDVADGLMNPNSQFYSTYNGWIDDEVNLIAMQPVNGKYPVLGFYIELFEFNNIPCMAYVNNKLKEYSSGKIDLIQDLSEWIPVHVPWHKRSSVYNSEFLVDHYIKKVGFRRVRAEVSFSASF